MTKKNKQAHLMARTSNKKGLKNITQEQSNFQSWKRSISLW